MGWISCGKVPTAWPDPSRVIELRYEWAHLAVGAGEIRGNAVILESAEVKILPCLGHTRAQATAGSAGLPRHAPRQEQRYPEDVGYRDGSASRTLADT
jgi:hypothetical protein